MKNFKRITIKEVMSENPIAATPKTIMTEISEIFESNSFHHVPILDDGVCVGIISKSDYHQLQDKFTKLNRRVAEIDNKRLFQSLIAEEIMSKDVICLDEGESAVSGLDIFLENKVHSIIVTKEGKCVGILTPYDLLKELKEEYA